MSQYGFIDDKVVMEESSTGGAKIKFGLNTGRMTAFGFIPNGGKNNAEQEALEIKFLFEGSDKEVGYRKFPITKAYDGENPVTDPNHPKMIEAQKNFSAIMVQLLSCYVPKETIQAAFANGNITSFKQYCDTLKALLPAGFENMKIDVFGQYQWTLRDNAKQTYVEVPNNLKHGSIFAKHVEGTWNAVNDPNNENMALSYSNGTTAHPFVRTKWFTESNFAKVQKQQSAADALSGALGAGPIAGAPAQGAPATPPATGAGW